MAAAAIAAKAAMMNSGEAVEERTDEELLAEVRTHPTLLSRGLVWQCRSRCASHVA